MANVMRDALEKAVAAWNRGDLDAYLELYDPEIRLHGYTPVPMTKPEVRGFYASFFEAFPRCQLVLDETVTEGSTLMTRFHVDVSHRGPFLGAPATGKSAALGGHTSMKFSGGRVVERWSTADFLGLMIDLGLMKRPG